MLQSDCAYTGTAASHHAAHDISHHQAARASWASSGSDRSGPDKAGFDIADFNELSGLLTELSPNKRAVIETLLNTCGVQLPAYAR